MIRKALTGFPLLASVAAIAMVLSLAAPPPADAYIVIQGDATFVQEVEECLEQIASSGGQAAANLSTLTGSGNQHTIRSSSRNNSCTPSNGTNASNGTGTGSTTTWDPNYTDPYRGPDVARDPCASLAHELSHAADANGGTWDCSAGGNGIPNKEIKACGDENEYRCNQDPKLPPRTKYGGVDLPR